MAVPTRVSGTCMNNQPYTNADTAPGTSQEAMLSVAMNTSWMKKTVKHTRAHQSQDFANSRMMQVNRRRPMEFIHDQPGQLDQQEHCCPNNASIH